MIPSGARAMSPRGRNAQICTAALWSACRCPRCAPENHQPPATGELANPPVCAVADRPLDPNSGTVGGLFDQEHDA